MQLKRIALPIGGTRAEAKARRDTRPPPSAPPPALTPLRRDALVVAHSNPVRRAAVQLLPKDHFEVHAFADADAGYDHYNQSFAELVVVGRDLPGMNGTVLCELIRQSRKGAGVALVLMSARYSDVCLGSRDCNAFGADTFLELPATPEQFDERIEQALARREPIERLNVLPVELARRVDNLYNDYDGLNYYELLAVPPEAETPAIRRAFHERSLQLHPDRHARLRGRHPHAWERINTVYKRISEAYKVLVDEERRRRYNLGVRQRGALRLSRGSLGGGPEHRELRLCQTDEARREVLESLELRSLGDLEGAEEAMARALAAEPNNEGLKQCLDSLHKLLDIIQRRGS